ncbi:MAG: hypothetical protein DRI99_01845 [Candidatus Aminicenantes bacterium]|nr:MAG: hypothetical protein DRJ11_09200 [Candidatus Aminicenantes bacterium]RLE05562.1 MAG: hypothetical protein DRI99_01845 [Candidatus Aminicenantes bacterium]
MVHFFLIVFLSLTSINLSSADHFYPEKWPLLTTFSLRQWQLDQIPGGKFFPTFFENLAPYTTFLTEENNGFALVDPPRVYFDGESWQQFSWSLNQLPINSALMPGTPGVMPPLGIIDSFNLIRTSPLNWQQGLNFSLQSPQASPPVRITLSHVWPNMKGQIPGARFMLQPHATTSERNLLLYNSRRQFTRNYFLDFVCSHLSESWSAILGGTYFQANRRFNDFQQAEATFEEPAKLILLGTGVTKNFSQVKLNWLALFNHLTRHNFNAELGRLPLETLSLKRTSFFSGINLASSGWQADLSFLVETNHLTPQMINFSKDLVDHDGEGFWPFTRWGSFTATTWRGKFSGPFFKPTSHSFSLQGYLDFKYSLLAARESIHQNNPIYFKGQPYQVILWQPGQSYQNTNSSFRGGLLGDWSASKNLSFRFKLFLQTACLRFSHKAANLNFIQPGFDLGITFSPYQSLQFLLAYGQLPWEIRENLNFFLEKQSPKGKIYFWSDNNQDGLFQPGEETSLYRLTGGPAHSPASELKSPVNRRLLFVFHSPLSSTFHLQLTSTIKEVKNNFWVKFKNNYGHYMTLKDKSLFHLDRPATCFLLSNYSFPDKPFYAELTLHLFGERPEKWYFSFSFMAHIGMGYTSFGNGPTANDIGLIDESQAFPNSWINGYGRVDGDRAFVGKMFFGFYLHPRLFLSASLKYRDGHPFAFIDTYQIGEERLFVFQTIQAENKKGIKGGPREDYLSDISLKLTYLLPLKQPRIDLSLSLFNAFDFGSELSEYVFSGGKRYALELQIPRSLRLNLQINW